MSKGERLRQLREKKGLSQVEAAERIGVSKQNLYKYEKDIITNIPSDIVERIAKLYETTPAYLMGWEDQAKKLSELKSRLSEKLSYEFDLANGLKIEIDKMTQNYEPSDVLRAARFMGAFLKADPKQQEIALEVLQLNQADP